MTDTLCYDTAAENIEDNFMDPALRAEVEASFCGKGCESEAVCTHEPEDADEADEAYGSWVEDNYDPDHGEYDAFEADRAADRWERSFWGD